jgi:alkylation response protein AidB-like acyl-CoA dehydrogenase
LAVTARRQADGYWEVQGTKTWVSRINEAVAFVVFFRDPDRAISAAVVQATDHHLYRETVEPLGLGGWSWGMLRLAGVRVDPRYDLVGPRGQGLAVFRRHLTSFRPLVTAAAVGCAAGVHQCVTRTLAGRQASGGLVRVRDNALIGLGRSHAQLSAALLSTLAAGRLVEAGHPMASVTVCVGKAAGVDTALRVVTDLGPLVGAQGFQRSHRVAKARADLTGLLYADGVHDSLYRAGGKALLTGSGSQTT